MNVMRNRDTRSGQQLICAIALLVLAGCQTPGWKLEQNPETAWHVQSATSEAPVSQPRAELHAITPALVARMFRNEDGAPFSNPPPVMDDDLRAYLIGPGDLLSVIVFGHPDLTNPAGTTESVESSGRLVDVDGEIFMPFIGELPVAGQTVDEIRRRIAEGLRPFINNPQVDVRVIQFRSQFVLVLGDLPRPCRVPIRDIPLTVLDALDQCTSLGVPVAGGGPMQDANAVQLIRDGSAHPLILSGLYRDGGGPIYLRGGDRILIDNRLNRVFMIGEFGDQAAVTVPAGGMSLADGIAAAGGINLGTASTSEIFVIRGLPGASGIESEDAVAHVYHLDARSVDALLLADRFPLLPRDVVYAAPADLVNFNRALNQLTPSLDILLRSAILFTR